MSGKELAYLGGHVQVLAQFDQPLDVGSPHGVLEGDVPILVKRPAYANAS